MAHPQGGSSSTVSRWNWNLEILVFLGEGKTGVPGEKPLGVRTRTSNKLNPHMTPSPGLEPGLHWWEASALTTAPSRPPWEYPPFPWCNYIKIKQCDSSYMYINCTHQNMDKDRSKWVISNRFCLVHFIQQKQNHNSLAG